MVPVLTSNLRLAKKNLLKKHKSSSRTLGLVYYVDFFFHVVVFSELKFINAKTFTGRREHAYIKLVSPDHFAGFAVKSVDGSHFCSHQNELLQTVVDFVLLLTGCQLI